jgi:hypothetical protein
MIAAFPPELEDHAFVDGYEEAEADGRIRTRPQRGRAFQRGGSAAAVLPVSLRLPATTAERARFRRFWEDELGHGALPFTIRDQAFDGVALADETGNRLADESGAPLLGTAVWVLIAGETAPRWTARPGGNWELSLELEVIQR